MVLAAATRTPAPIAPAANRDHFFLSPSLILLLVLQKRAKSSQLFLNKLYSPKPFWRREVARESTVSGGSEGAWVQVRIRLVATLNFEAEYSKRYSLPPARKHSMQESVTPLTSFRYSQHISQPMRRLLLKMSSMVPVSPSLPFLSLLLKWTTLP